MLANFIPAYQQLVVDVAGVNLFHPNDDKDPPYWNWPELRGYSKDVMDTVWARITGSHDFWVCLPETVHCSTLRMCVLDLSRFHDIYFVTSRPGTDTKWQTEQWLILHLGIERPTVLLSSEKGLVAKALKLDCYIDDNLDNVKDACLMSPATRTYLLNRAYNQDSPPDTRYIRIETLGQFLDRELVNL